jgi:hypothetical protein
MKLKELSSVLISKHTLPHMTFILNIHNLSEDIDECSNNSIIYGGTSKDCAKVHQFTILYPVLNHNVAHHDSADSII